MDRNAKNGVHQRRSAIVRRANATPAVEFFNLETAVDRFLPLGTRYEL